MKRRKPRYHMLAVPQATFDGLVLLADKVGLRPSQYLTRLVARRMARRGTDTPR